MVWFDMKFDECTLLYVFVKQLDDDTRTQIESGIGSFPTIWSFSWFGFCIDIYVMYFGIPKQLGVLIVEVSYYFNLIGFDGYFIVFIKKMHWFSRLIARAIFDNFLLVSSCLYSTLCRTVRFILHTSFVY